MSTKERYRTKAGRLSKIYQKMQERAARRGDNHILSRAQFYAWASEHNSEFDSLFNAWVISGYKMRLAPTIDRIDITGVYEVGNIQFLSHSENVAKGNAETKCSRTYPGGNKKPVMLFNGSETLEFVSGKEACDFLGLSRGMVSCAIARNSALKGWSVRR